MAGFGIQFQAIEILQFLNLFERVLAERRLPIKCVQNDSLQQIAKSQIVVVGKRLKHFEQALLDPNPGLGRAQPEMSDRSSWVPLYQGTNLPTRPN